MGMAWRIVPDNHDFAVSFKNVLLSREPISLIMSQSLSIGAFVECLPLPGNPWRGAPNRPAFSH
jgi:hypothetical protein